MSRRSRRNIPELDGLRGIAILLVFLTHFVALQLPTGTGGVDGSVRWVARFGWTGVDLFFVLSGFLITGILLDSKGDAHYWRNYAARRVLRIFPLYYGALLAVFVILPHVVHWNDPDFATLRANQLWYWTYMVNVLQAVKGGAATPLNTSHFWSLCVEEQFYLVWPAVVLVSTPRGLVRVAVAASLFGMLFRIALVSAGAKPGIAYVLTPGHLDGLMAGATLAVAAREGGLERFRRVALRVFGFTSAVILVLAAWRGMEYTDPVIAIAGFPLIAACYGALLVLGTTSTGWLGRLLRARHLRAWGKYSYGLYLLHYPLLGVLDDKLGPSLDRLTWGGSHLPGVLALCVVGLPMSYAIAWASYNLYEKRFLALKRYFGAAHSRVPEIGRVSLAVQASTE